MKISDFWISFFGKRKMIQNKTVTLHICILLLILLVPAVAGAIPYPQPSFVSSFYLCNKLVRQGNSIQPDKVLQRALTADNPKETFHVIVSFVGSKGVHSPEIEILDKKGRLFLDRIQLDSVTLKEDGEAFMVAQRISGRFPEGGIFFKISDTLDSGSRTMLGMFAVRTDK